MNELCRCTKHTNIDYDLRVIEIPLCSSFFLLLLNPNFHIIEDKTNKNKSGHFQGTQGTYSRLARTTSTE
jgi:hypothetical protein